MDLQYFVEFPFWVNYAKVVSNFNFVKALTTNPLCLHCDEEDTRYKSVLFCFVQRAVDSTHTYSHFLESFFSICLITRKACNGFARLTRFHLLYLSSSPFPIWIRSWKSYDTLRGILSLTLLGDFLSKEAKMGLFPSWGLGVSNQGQMRLYFLTHFGLAHLDVMKLTCALSLDLSCLSDVDSSFTLQKLFVFGETSNSIAVYLQAVFMWYCTP